MALLLEENEESELSSFPIGNMNPDCKADAFDIEQVLVTPIVLIFVIISCRMSF